MNKTTIVYSLRIATKLVDAGFNIVDTRINLKNPKLKVFIFDDTEEFRAAFDSLAN